MPDVNYDIGEMYAGNVPIANNQSENLYFVFQPKLGDPVDEITIWLNGGPGCRYYALYNYGLPLSNLFFCFFFFCG